MLILMHMFFYPTLCEADGKQ